MSVCIGVCVCVECVCICGCVNILPEALVGSKHSEHKSFLLEFFLVCLFLVFFFFVFVLFASRPL